MMSSSGLQDLVNLTKRDASAARERSRALDLRDFDDLVVLSAGVDCKEAAWETGGLEVAEEIFRRLVERSPSFAPAFYELAVVHRFQRRLDEALKRASQAAALAPGHHGYGLFQAHMYYANACWDEGDAVLDALPSSTDLECRESLAMREFGAYLREFPRDRARYITRSIRERHYWMEVREVAEAIRAAIRERRGFALIRLGDGEGTFIRVNDRDEAAYRHLYAHHRRFWITFLLGETFDPTWTGYLGLTDRLLDFATEADILGVAYWEWIDYEYSIAADRTIPCLLSINRAVMENVRHVTLCNQDMHLQLHRTGLLAEIMREVTSLTVISCLDGLDAKIREMFGVADVDLIKVPSEDYAPHLAGKVQKPARPHFPFVFWDIVATLSQPHHGRVFLIAAGTFGKYYAAIIKRHGGVALDLGSIVDGWMKMASRPFYSAMFEIDDKAS
ncbi:tetratricopeptide repeat protein [Methylobacterium oryzihabitans]|uniref:Uncharacterized protein n=1 Tax=Methylobacterium oryzihabitans TaxID=2499852 RepID=A0A3S2V4B4_9HYPH|nr:tetratricopeptide repeat protein [Methylobacterium oryzihabitans]RVU13923.1 hypothetical protein EOE48_25625 [Methylobacterium oryzihabitans]